MKLRARGRKSDHPAVKALIRQMQEHPERPHFHADAQGIIIHVNRRRVDYTVTVDNGVEQQWCPMRLTLDDVIATARQEVTR